MNKEDQLFRLNVRYVAKCMRAMRDALQDAMNVFTDEGQVVTAERREAWQEALKMLDGDPRPKLPKGWTWVDVSVPESKLGPDFYDGRAMGLMDAAKCNAAMSACTEAAALAKKLREERDEAVTCLRECLSAVDIVNDPGSGAEAVRPMQRWREAAK